MEPEYSNDQEPDPMVEIEFLTPSVNCWRCHLEYHPSLAKCPHCAAENRQASPGYTRPPQISTSEQPKSIKIVFVTYGLILGTSLVMAVIAGAAAINPKDAEKTVVGTTIAVELIDSVLVIGALCISGLAYARMPPVPKLSLAVIHWILYIVGLGGMLLLNLAYHGFLNQLLDLPPTPNVMPGSWAVVLILFCIQPAIIEELFCRQLCMAAFQQYVNIHLSVLFTAMMFALFHIFVPLSVPYLFLLGVFLGYSRVYGGTVVLPIILHFIHNLVVVLIQNP